MDGLNPELMAQGLKHLPRILSVASAAPSFIVGFVLTFAYFIFYVGPTAFRTSYAPVSGFHIVSLFLLRVLWQPLQDGLRRWRWEGHRIEGRRSFNKEIQMMSHQPKLD